VTKSGQSSLLAAGAVLLAAALLTACGGSGPINLPTPTRSLTAGPTRTFATPTRGPTRTPPASTTRTSTDSPSATDTESPSPTDTESPSPTSTNEPGSPTTEAPSPTSRTTTVTNSATSTRSPAPSPSPSAGTSSDRSGVPGWLWFVIAALLVAVAAAIPLVVGARRRRAWWAALSSCEEEVAWFARVLAPQLRQAPTTERAAGAWGVESGRVIAVEDKLTELRSSAPDEAGRARAGNLRDAVRQSRGRIESLFAAAADRDSLAAGLSEVAASLEAALRPPDSVAS
jgi:hypothetical protein